jgi:hypothetical protein
MRALNIVCGVAILLLTLHFTHVLHHFFLHSPSHSPAFWAGMVAATVVWGFSFVGGCLLLRRGR